MIPQMTPGEWLTIGTFASAIIGSYVLIQSNIKDHGKRILRLEVRDEQARVDASAVRELLIRIDERTLEMKRKQDSAR